MLGIMGTNNRGGGKGMRQRGRDKQQLTRNHEELIITRLAGTLRRRALTLSITTRGIGFGVCQISTVALVLNALLLKQLMSVSLPSCYSLYRVFLAVLETKLAILKAECTITSSNMLHDVTYICQLHHLDRKVTFAPTPLVKLINAVGILKDCAVYIPAVHDDLTDREGQIVPRPETVLYSNLRSTVVALSNPATPESIRLYFEDHNPIPGAIFEGHVLINPDEIMPEDYTLDELQSEILLLPPFLIELQKHYPKLVAGKVDFKSTGSPSQLISNELEDLRVPSRRTGQSLEDWYSACLSLGNIRTYFALFKLTAAERFEGQINLLGELPEQANVRYPFYANRDPSVCPRESASDYHGVHQILYST